MHPINFQDICCKTLGVDRSTRMVWCCLKQFVHCQLLVLNCQLLNVCIIFVVFVPIVLNCLLVVLSAHKRHQALNAWLLARPFLAHCSSAHFLPSRIHFCLFDFFPLPHICLSLYKIPFFIRIFDTLWESTPPPSSLGKIQTLSVTFTLRTSLEDVRGHSNRTSGDIPTGCPAMFYFCIFT